MLHKITELRVLPRINPTFCELGVGELLLERVDDSLPLLHRLILRAKAVSSAFQNRKVSCKMTARSVSQVPPTCCNSVALNNSSALSHSAVSSPSFATALALLPFE